MWDLLGRQDNKVSKDRRGHKDLREFQVYIKYGRPISGFKLLFTTFFLFDLLNQEKRVKMERTAETVQMELTEKTELMEDQALWVRFFLPHFLLLFQNYKE